jgi:hypothetical protein
MWSRLSGASISTMFATASKGRLASAMESHGQRDRALEVLQFATIQVRLASEQHTRTIWGSVSGLRAWPSLPAMHQGPKTAIEFQKVLVHQGVTVGDPVGIMAHLGLARAYGVAGDSANASSRYQEFFSLWKAADSNVTIGSARVNR